MSIKFPIRLAVNAMGNDYTKELKEGGTVRCLRCGKKIKINSYTVSLEREAEESPCDLPYITCTCGYKAFALYYIEQQEKDSWKHRRVRDRSLV